MPAIKVSVSNISQTLLNISQTPSNFHVERLELHGWNHARVVHHDENLRGSGKYLKIVGKSGKHVGICF